NCGPGLANVTLGAATVQVKLSLALCPPSLAVTVTLYGVVEAAPPAMVPEIRPVVGLMLSPPGKPVELNVTTHPKGSQALDGAPAESPVTSRRLPAVRTAICGAGATCQVNIRFKLAAPSVAVTVTKYGLASWAVAASVP